MATPPPTSVQDWLHLKQMHKYALVGSRVPAVRDTSSQPPFLVRGVLTPDGARVTDLTLCRCVMRAVAALAHVSVCVRVCARVRELRNASMPAVPCNCGYPNVPTWRWIGG